MTETDVVLDLLGDYSSDMHEEIEGLEQEELNWGPDSQANSIGITTWHVARWLDVLGTRMLQGKSAEQEQWQSQGWTEKTGYDPRGIGYRGLGAITGYTQEEVAAIPKLNADELMSYFDQSFTIVRETLQTMPPEKLQEQVPDAVFKGTIYRWLRGLMAGFFGHVGEIQAIKALYKRAAIGSVR